MKIVKKIVNIIFFFVLALANVCKAEVRVAIVVPRTGEYKIWGDELIFGAQTAVDEINQSGGVCGKKLELVSIDDTCNDNLAISTAQMLSVSSSIKPSLIIGPYCSNSFNEVAKIYSKAKIFQIVPTSLNYDDTYMKHKGVIKLGSFKEQIGKDFFEIYNNKYAGTKIAIISDNRLENVKEMSFAIADEFRKYGKASLLKQYYFNEYDHLDNLAQDIINGKYGIVYLLGNPKKTGKIISKLGKLNENMVFFTDKSIATDAFFEYAEANFNKVYFMALPSFDDNPKFAENLVNLRLKDIEFVGLNIYGYAAIKMWSDIVEQTNSFSCDKLALKINSNRINNMWKDTFFNNTNTKNTIHYKLYQFKNNEFIGVD